MKILKFGGTSVGTADRMKAVAELIRNPEAKIVVLSAMAGTTNKLVEIGNLLYQAQPELAKKEIDELHAKYKQVVAALYSTATMKDQANQLIATHFDALRSFTQQLFTEKEEKAVLAQGELLSTALFHLYLLENGINSVLLPALNFMRIKADEEPDTAFIAENLQAELAKHAGKTLFITQGYICRNDRNKIDNLKRGGSDYSASLIGAAVQAEEIQIWTDISGMHNNDPRIVPDTYPIAELSFDEAAELAYFGAKILHPSSILPAKHGNIPVRLLNTMQPQDPGTRISSRPGTGDIKAVAAKDGIVAIKIKSSRMLLAYGFLRNVFEVFERYKTPIDMITTSEVAVSLTIDNASHLDEIVEDLQQFGRVEAERDQTIICVVGDFLAEHSGTAIEVFSSLRHIPIRMISYGGSKNNISLLIHTAHKNQALLALNEGVFKVRRPNHA